MLNSDLTLGPRGPKRVGLPAIHHRQGSGPARFQETIGVESERGYWT